MEGNDISGLLGLTSWKGWGNHRLWCTGGQPQIRLQCLHGNHLRRKGVAAVASCSHTCPDTEMGYMEWMGLRLSASSGMGN